MITSLLISGFGGQGLMSLGKLLARAAMIDGKQTTWFPSYGAEMRGGTAHCGVKIADEEIASPLVGQPDIAVLMNQPSLDKFGFRVKSGGLLIINDDLAYEAFVRDDLTVVRLSLNQLALEVGSDKAANMIALGIVCAKRPKLVARETVLSVLAQMFPRKDVARCNVAAFEKGEQIGQS